MGTIFLIAQKHNHKTISWHLKIQFYHPEHIEGVNMISARSLLLLTPKDTSEEICHIKHLQAGVNSLSVAFPSKVGVLQKLKNAADRWMVVLHLHIMKKR